MTLPLRVLISLTCAVALYGQAFSSAYRVLGQTDLRQNGLNLVQGGELNQPRSIALNSRGGQNHLYIADTRNSRLLAWAGVPFYQTGAAPSLVLGKPGPQSAAPLGIGTKGFVSPLGLAVNPLTGDLYV